jgi:F-type H+-transporting ATPase subunit epsilon
MSTHTLHVLIATVSETLFNGPADAIIVPGTGGEMTILANHEPIITTLKPGSLKVKIHRGEVKEFQVNRGVLEVVNSTANILL